MGCPAAARSDAVWRRTAVPDSRQRADVPKVRAICEHFLGSLRRECLDHFLIWGERYLYRVVKEYKEYFNHACPHQGIEQHIPCRPQWPEALPVAPVSFSLQAG
jgi:hypothetical protein